MMQDMEQSEMLEPGPGPTTTTKKGRGKRQASSEIPETDPDVVR
jgi:hypothetical protein